MTRPVLERQEVPNPDSHTLFDPASHAGLTINRHTLLPCSFQTGLVLDPEAGSHSAEPPSLLNWKPDTRPRRFRHFNKLLYGLAALTLLVYSVVYYSTAHKSRTLGFITSASLIVLDGVTGSFLLQAKRYEEKLREGQSSQILVRPLLHTPAQALLLASVYRLLLISFGVYYWFLGHCLAYTLVGSLLAVEAMMRFFPVVSEDEMRRQLFRDTIEKLRGAFQTPTQGQGLSGQLAPGIPEPPNRWENVPENFFGGAFPVPPPEVGHSRGSGSDPQVASSSGGGVASGGVSRDHGPPPSVREAHRVAAGARLGNGVRGGPSRGPGGVNNQGPFRSEYLPGREGGDVEMTRGYPAQQWSNEEIQGGAWAAANGGAVGTSYSGVRDFMQDRSGAGYANPLTNCVDGGRFGSANLVVGGGQHGVSRGARVVQGNVEATPEERFKGVLLAVAGTPWKIWGVLTALFVLETVLVAVTKHPEVEVISSSHKQVRGRFYSASLYIETNPDPRVEQPSKTGRSDFRRNISTHGAGLECDCFLELPRPFRRQPHIRPCPSKAVSTVAYPVSPIEGRLM